MVQAAKKSTVDTSWASGHSAAKTSYKAPPTAPPKGPPPAAADGDANVADATDAADAEWAEGHARKHKKDKKDKKARRTRSTKRRGSTKRTRSTKRIGTGTGRREAAADTTAVTAARIQMARPGHPSANATTQVAQTTMAPAPKCRPRSIWWTRPRRLEQAARR